MSIEVQNSCVGLLTCNQSPVCRREACVKFNSKSSVERLRAFTQIFVGNEDVRLFYLAVLQVIGPRLARDEAVEYAPRLKDEYDLIEDVVHGMKPPIETSKQKEARRRDDLRSFGEEIGVLQKLRTTQVSLRFLSNVFKSAGCLTILVSSSRLNIR